MSEQNAAASMTAVVDILTSPRVATGGTTPGTTGRVIESKTAALPMPLEYWAKRIMWVMVAVTSLWDIAETFDMHITVLSKVVPHP
jgi:hypothetical protein